MPSDRKVLMCDFFCPQVSRALGIPCRVVTNFGSAHDTNSNLLIEFLYDEDGNDISDDSVW